VRVDLGDWRSGEEVWQVGIRTLMIACAGNRAIMNDRLAAWGDGCGKLSGRRRAADQCHHNAVRGLSNETNFTEIKDVDILDGHIWRMRKRSFRAQQGFAQGVW